MAEIRRFPLIRHFRADSTSHVLAFRKGALARSGRGLTFWFFPMGAAIVEIPIDDRDQAFVFATRTRDFQELSVAGVVTFRVVAPERLSERIDFSIDPERGVYKRLPLDQLSTLLTGLARRISLAHVARSTLDELLASGIEQLQRAIEEGLTTDQKLTDMGIEVVSARVDDLKPTPDVARALETPTREALQKSADEATFARRAFAVEKERAIAENELQNQIELARREADLIAHRGKNERDRVTEEVEAQRIVAVAGAGRAEIERETNAARIRLIGAATAEAERGRLAAQESVPREVLYALAAHELAQKLHIEHLSITPELIGPALARFLDANANGASHPTGTKRGS